MRLTGMVATAGLKPARRTGCLDCEPIAAYITDWSVSHHLMCPARLLNHVGRGARLPSLRSRSPPRATYLSSGGLPQSGSMMALRKRAFQGYPLPLLCQQGKVIQGLVWECMLPMFLETEGRIEQFEGPSADLFSVMKMGWWQRIGDTKRLALPSRCWPTPGISRSCVLLSR